MVRAAVWHDELSGHFTTGIMLAAGTGRALAGWIGSGRRPPEAATFDLPTSWSSTPP